MAFYFEGLFWYFLLIDSLFYFIMTFSKDKLHQKQTHWISDYLPYERGFAYIYLGLTLWMGLMMWRLQLIFNF
ncbi:MAG: hypothetical protein WCV90_04215 [Candidatus Woesearchaeota archaeon]